jgi:hypothetical protein
MTQLKNSGGIRLIEDYSVSDSIVSYYSEFESHAEQLRYNLEAFQKIIELEVQLFDFKVFTDNKVKPTIKDSDKIKELYNRILLLYLIIRNENEWLKSYKTKGISLLSFLKKEYQL